MNLKGFILCLSLIMSSVGMAQNSITASVKLSPLGSFEVKSEKMRGNLNKNEDGSYVMKKMSLKVKSLKSGINLRDEHMHKAMIVKESDRVTVTNFTGNDNKGSAILELRGIEKPIKISYTVSDKVMKIDFTISLKDFEFENINYKGVGVEDKLNISGLIAIE